MATLTKFKQWVQKNPGLALSGAGVSISAANLATNVSRRSETNKLQRQQLKAMNRLTESIHGLDTTLEEPKASKRIQFRLGNYGK